MSLTDIIGSLMFLFFAVYNLRPFSEREYQRAMRARDRAIQAQRSAIQQSRNQNLELL